MIPQIPGKTRIKEKGFTLLEIIVVISILLVLAAMLMPLFSRAKASSLEAKTLQQLRQLGAAMSLYVSENDQYFPPGYFYAPDSFPRERTWASELLYYLGLPRSYYEAQDNPFVSPNSVIPVRSGVSATFTPFTYSIHGGISPDISVVDNRVKLGNIVRPSEVILLGDGSQLPSTYSASTLTRPEVFKSGQGTVQNLDQHIAVGPDVDGMEGRGWLRYRNRGKVAVLMVDGHVEMIVKGELRYRNVIYDR